jgi:hypothetical protein
MSESVECISSSAYAGRPIAIHWQGQRLIITEILSQGRTPEAKWFRVRTTGGQTFELSTAVIASGDPSKDEWKINQI